MIDLTKDIHERLCELLNREGAIYRVVEHEPEGRTEFIAKISRQQARAGDQIHCGASPLWEEREPVLSWPTFPVIAAWIYPPFNPFSMAPTRRLRRVKKPRC